MLITSTYFFITKPPASVVHPHTSALGQAYSTVSPSTITSSYQPKRNHQVSTLWYKLSGTPTSSFFFNHLMYHEWYTPHGSTIYVPTSGTLSGTHSVPYRVPHTRHTVSDSPNGSLWEHLLGHYTQPVSADVPHPQVPLRI